MLSSFLLLKLRDYSLQPLHHRYFFGISHEGEDALKFRKFPEKPLQNCPLKCFLDVFDHGARTVSSAELSKLY